MSRPGRRASTAFCLAVAILSASAASARTERFRWTHTGSVTGFRRYWGPASGSYSSSMNVGVPSKDSTGAYSYDLVVPDADTIYVTVTAWSDTLESLRSNEISRAGITGGSTTPPPPPAPTTPSAAVVGFALWNAATDTVVDTSFANGDTISDAIRGCAAIEIKTNTYLNGSGPGSIKKVFDGVDNGCSGAGSYENTSPYGYPDADVIGKFDCATSLSTVGSHTLKVTPYDGDNCSGAVGTPASISFTVQGSTSSGSPLSAPGQPFIVP